MKARQTKKMGNIVPLHGLWHRVDVCCTADVSEIVAVFKQKMYIGSPKRRQYSVHLQGVIIQKQDSY